MLPQYRGRKEPVFHKFVVFSVIDDSDTVIPKYCQCNNCGAVHKVYDICKSEMITGRDELKTATTVSEVRRGLPSDIREVLDAYDCDLPIWENVLFIYLNKQWGQTVVLTRDTINNEVQGKALRLNGEDEILIENYIVRESV
tara:strand:+ start:116 stop:541 length:426 start_codon:yes stop_codon:yes gene_type:complete